MFSKKTLRTNLKKKKKISSFWIKLGQLIAELMNMVLFLKLTFILSGKTSFTIYYCSFHQMISAYTQRMTLYCGYVDILSLPSSNFCIHTASDSVLRLCGHPGRRDTLGSKICVYRCVTGSMRSQRFGAGNEKARKLVCKVKISCWIRIRC